MQSFATMTASTCVLCHHDVSFVTMFGFVGCRWYRDPNQPIPRTDITRFPHAVLEVKLSLPEGHTSPEWVTDLTESGLLTEVGLNYNRTTLKPGCGLWLLSTEHYRLCICCKLLMTLFACPVYWTVTHPGIWHACVDQLRPRLLNKHPPPPDPTPRHPTPPHPTFTV